METPKRNAQLGYIKSIPDDMDGLFARWYERTKNIGVDSKDGDDHYCLVCDGIIRKRALKILSLILASKAYGISSMVAVTASTLLIARITTGHSKVLLPSLMPVD